MVILLCMSDLSFQTKKPSMATNYLWSRKPCLSRFVLPFILQFKVIWLLQCICNMFILYIYIRYQVIVSIVYTQTLRLGVKVQVPRWCFEGTNFTLRFQENIFWDLLIILLIEEILHHLTCMKPCKQWDIYLSTGAGFLPSTVFHQSLCCRTSCPLHRVSLHD